MPSSPLKSVPRSAQLVFLLGTLMLLAASAIHVFSDLPPDYTWSRTLTLFWQAITDSYFLVMAFFVLLAARLRPTVAETVPNPWLLPHFLFAGLLTISTVWVLLDSSNSYTRADLVCLIPVALLLLRSLRDRHLGFALFGLLSTVGILMLVSYVFTIFKSQLFVPGIVLDGLLISGEKMIFGQPLYLTIATWAQANTAVVHFSDWVYYLFFHHMALVALFLFTRGEHAEQWRYVAALSLCYLLGALSYYLLPALGPAYHDPGSFTYLKSEAPFTSGIQRFLWNSTTASVHGSLSKIHTFAFIACMPSLHMAHETIMLFYSRRSPLMLLFSGLVWLSSCLAVLVLGWHYLFDVIAGVFLAGSVIAFVRHRPAADSVLA